MKVKLLKTVHEAFTWRLLVEHLQMI